MIDGNVAGVPVQNGLAFSVFWINYGQIPAINVGVLIWVEGSDGEIIVPAAMAIEAVPRNGLSGPGNTHGTAMCFLNDEQTAAFRSGRLQIHIRSQVIYSDAFQGGDHSSSVIFHGTHQGGTIERNGQKVEAINYQMIESTAS